MGWFRNFSRGTGRFLTQASGRGLHAIKYGEDYTRKLDDHTGGALGMAYRQTHVSDVVDAVRNPLKLSLRAMQFAGRGIQDLANARNIDDFNLSSGYQNLSQAYELGNRARTIGNRVNYIN